MEEKNTFIAFLDDDNKKKEVWCEILEETTTYVTFRYNNDTLTIPYHRILKIKRKRDDMGNKE